MADGTSVLEPASEGTPKVFRSGYGQRAIRLPRARAVDREASAEHPHP